MKIVQDGTLVDVDTAALTNNTRRARLTGVYARGRVVGHHDWDDENALMVYIQFPLKSPARYVWRRFVKLFHTLPAKKDSER